MGEEDRRGTFEGASVLGWIEAGRAGARTRGRSLRSRALIQSARAGEGLRSSSGARRAFHQLIGTLVRVVEPRR